MYVKLFTVYDEAVPKFARVNSLREDTIHFMKVLHMHGKNCTPKTCPRKLVEETK